MWSMALRASVQWPTYSLCNPLGHVFFGIQTWPNTGMFNTFIPPTARPVHFDQIPALPWRSRAVIGVVVGGFFGFLAWMLEPDIGWPLFLAAAAGFALGLLVRRVAPTIVSAVPRNVLW